MRFIYIYTISFYASYSADKSVIIPIYSVPGKDSDDIIGLP